MPFSTCPVLPNPFQCPLTACLPRVPTYENVFQRKIRTFSTSLHLPESPRTHSSMECSYRLTLVNYEKFHT